MRKIINRALYVISVGLLITSLTQQCYCTTSFCGDSIAVFFSGALGFFLSPAGATWLANPLLITSWVTINRNPRLSLITSLLATLLAVSFLLFTKVMDNENGDLNEIVSYKIGYWLWLAACLTMLIRNGIVFLQKNNSNHL